MATEDLKLSEWERSKISNQDESLLKKLGFLKKEKMLIFPGEERFPTPGIGYRLHQLTPNSILHISIFITLCECFLGTPTNWGLWKRIFLVRRNSSQYTAYNVGGVVICDVDSQEYNVAPFDGSEKILRCLSWDVEATDEEKTATEALMKRTHELQNTHGKELSDVDRLSKDLSVKDLEKLVRKISSLSKKDAIPTSCHVEPYSGTNALPKKYQIVSSLPPLPEGGEVEEQTVVTDENQGISRPESEVARSQKSAASSERETESEASGSAHSIPSALSPRNKRKRGDAEGSSTSKPRSSPAEEPALEGTSPKEEETDTSPTGDEKEEPTVNVTAPMSTSQTLAFSETHRTAGETSPPQHDLQRSTPAASPRASSPKRARIELGKEYDMAGSSAAPPLDDPLMQHFISLGTQFIRYRDTVNGLKEALAKANKRADDLSVKLEQSDQARKKAEQDAASVGDLPKRLHKAETALSEKITQQIAKEEDVIGRLESQNHLFAIDAKTAFTRLFPYFFPKKDKPSTFAALTKCFIPEEDLGLALRQENLKIGIEGTISLVTESQQTVDWVKICHSKLEMTKVVETVHAKLKKRRRFVDKINDRVTPVAEEMIDDLLRMDADFFMEGHYANFVGASADEDRVNIDELIGHD
ncbi:hypothetical protein QYE76_048544 [Lolium multiflorum]|uniref:Transposase (putative) gypsy type domain-containing protein n=1 Tax=Lolium multiflorum TaxID=4521 RepID=A0AAD8WHF6_LOLMU|nr:hypothetical protein QYE76_048544 [Lolium multiflorum]